MKIIKMSLVAALLASSTLVADIVSDVEVSANVALTSNYIWRGMTQSHNSLAVQGGADLGYKGAYIGTWASNVNFGDDSSVEIDIYAGYAMDIGDFNFDIGYNQFIYPNESDELNFGEAYLKVGYDFKVVSVGAAYYVGVDTNDVNNDDDWKPDDAWEVSASIPLPMDFSMDATYGDYDTLGAYYLIGLNRSFGKFDFTVAYTANDGDGVSDDKQDNFVATVGTSF